MDYAQAVAYLNGLVDYERSPDPRIARQWNLDRMRALLRAVGSPHDSLKAVHIAGTKGKGSTAAMLAAILRRAGYSVGLFTSPHLICFRERIRLNGKCIPRSAVARLTERLRPHIERLRRTGPFAPSFFEAHTALAFLYFAEKKPDLVVLETGLGGRLDATNVVTPLACAITTIGIDHTAELGGTISQIATEKAGIIKRNTPIICAPQPAAAAAVIAAACEKRRARVFHVKHSCALAVRERPDSGVSLSVWSASPHSADGQVFTVRGLSGLYEGLFCPLAGSVQPVNAAVAVGLAELLARKGFHITEKHIRAGIRSVRWPGRLQTVGQDPRIVLDCAHDGISARALARDIEALFPSTRVFLILGVSRDKNPRAIGRPLLPLAHSVFLTAAPLPRAMEPEALHRGLSSLCARAATAPTVADALAAAHSLARPDGLILVTGSVYIVGEAMKALGLESLCTGPL